MNISDNNIRMNNIEQKLDIIQNNHLSHIEKDISKLTENYNGMNKGIYNLNEKIHNLDKNMNKEIHNLDKNMINMKNDMNNKLTEITNLLKDKKSKW